MKTVDKFLNILYNNYNDQNIYNSHNINAGDISMAPRKLTDSEMLHQKQRLLEKGKDLLLSYGVKKTSVEDITNAAGMAKGTFYNHFDSKEDYFLELLTQIHTTWFQQAELYFTMESPESLKDRLRNFIRKCFDSYEFLAFFKYHDEFREMLLDMQARSDPGIKDLMEMEHATYERLLKMFNFDTQKVKPGVVHNYLHAMYFGIVNVRLMEADSLEETFEALLNGLIGYIFGGIS